MTQTPQHAGHPDAGRTHAHRIGVVGAGRVGAVLAAALRAAGHEIVAAAGESAASRTRIETLLPGVPALKPTAVARACDLLLLTVPDDMLAQRRRPCSPPPARSARASTSCTPPAGTASPCSQPRRRRRRPPGRAAPGDDLHRHRRRPRPAAPAASSASPPATPSGRSPRRLVADLGGRADVGARGARARSTTPASPTAPTTWSPWSPRRWSCCAPPAPTTPPPRCARCSPPRSTTRSTYGDAALTGPIVRGDVETVRAHLADIARLRARTRSPSYVAMARATANRAVADGRLLPIRAAKLVGMLDDALVPRRARTGQAAAVTGPDLQ